MWVQALYDQRLEDSKGLSEPDSSPAPELGAACRTTHLTMRNASGSISAKAVRYTMAFFLLQFWMMSLARYTRLSRWAASAVGRKIQNWVGATTSNARLHYNELTTTLHLALVIFLRESNKSPSVQRSVCKHDASKEINIFHFHSTRCNWIQLLPVKQKQLLIERHLHSVLSTVRQLVTKSYHVSARSNRPTLTNNILPLPKGST